MNQLALAGSPENPPPPPGAPAMATVTDLLAKRDGGVADQLTCLRGLRCAGALAVVVCQSAAPFPWYPSTHPYIHPPPPLPISCLLTIIVFGKRSLTLTKWALSASGIQTRPFVKNNMSMNNKWEQCRCQTGARVWILSEASALLLSCSGPPEQPGWTRRHRNVSPG